MDDRIPQGRQQLLFFLQRQLNRFFHRQALTRLPRGLKGSFTLSRNGTFPPTDTFGTFNFVSAGTYSLRLVYYEHAGGAEVELFARSGSFTSFNTGFRLVGDTAGGGLALVSPDAIAPTANPTQSPAANGAGWNNSNVTVNWNWTDNAGGSGIDAANCTTSSLSSTEGNPLTLNATCKDLAGNTGSASYTLKVDKTNPTISGSRSPAANGAGWNNSDVNVSFACSDPGFGLAAGSPPANTVLSGEGASLSAMGTCFDVAGNSASNTQSGIKIDRTAPNTNLTAPSGWNNVDVTLTLNPNDALSGVNATYFILDNGAAQSGTHDLCQRDDRRKPVLLRHVDQSGRNRHLCLHR